MKGDPVEAGGAAGRSHTKSVPGVVTDVLLRRLADLLAAQGMEIRKHEHGKEIIEVAVVNPRDPDKGRAVVGYDGLLIWEYRSALKVDSDVDKCAEIIWVLLGQKPTQSALPVCPQQKHP